MAKKTKPQIARVEQPFGMDPPIVYCPICGHATVKIDETNGADITPCDHLAFIHAAEGGFVCKSEDFEARMARVEEAEEDWEDEEGVDYFDAALQRAGYQNNMLAIEITYGGMGQKDSFTTGHAKRRLMGTAEIEPRRNHESYQKYKRFFQDSLASQPKEAGKPQSSREKRRRIDR